MTTSVIINYMAVFWAALSSLVVASVWYQPALFGTTWMRLTGVRPSHDRLTTKGMVRMYGTVFVASLLTAYVLARVMFLVHSFFKDGWVGAGLGSAFWLWLGFTAARLFVHDAFEERRHKLTILNAVYELITVLVMGLVLGLIPPHIVLPPQ